MRETAILRLGLMGDPHYGWPDVDNYYAGDIIQAWMGDPKFPPIDLAINLGDFVSGDFFDTAEQLESLWKQAMTNSFNHLYLPWLIALGNHDIQEGMPNISVAEREVLALRETGLMHTSYALQWHNILFLVLGWRTSPEEELAWLEHMTSQHLYTTTVLVGHSGPREQMRELIEKNPQIKLFIHGHGHNFRHYTFQGIDVLECGHTNDAESWTGRPWTAYLEITSDRIRAQFYDVHEQRWVTEMGHFERTLSTNIQPKGLQWYSISRPIQDGLVFSHPNKIIAEEYKLQLSGVEESIVVLNGAQYRGVRNSFNLPAELMKNKLEWEIFSPSGSGGWIDLVYKNPLLWSPQLSFGRYPDLGGEEFIIEQVAQHLSNDQVVLIPLGQKRVEVVGAKALSSRLQPANSLKSQDLPDTIKLMTTQPKPPQVELKNLHFPASVCAFDIFEVGAEVSNTGGPLTLRLGLYVDGELNEDRILSLDENEVLKITYELEIRKPGLYELAIGTLKPQSIEVKPGTPF